MPNDIAGQAQANWFNQANAQASMPWNPGRSSAPIPMRAPIIQPVPVRQMGPSPNSIPGLMAGVVQRSPLPLGGLMDFNRLAFNMSQPQAQMPYSNSIMDIFRRALPALPVAQQQKNKSFTDSSIHKAGMVGLLGPTGFYETRKLRDLF